MKKPRYIVSILLLLFLFSGLSYSQNIVPYANITDSWIVDNVDLNGEKGIEIHVKLDIYNHGTFEARVAFLFFLEDGTILKDFNGEYVSVSGQVSTSAEFIPKSSESSTEVVVFIPYDEMHVKGAKANLKCLAVVYDYRGRWIAVSDYIYFSVGDY